MLADAMLPALYEGTLPCADCTGIRYSLDIRAYRVYFLRQTYLGKRDGTEESFDDIGVWSASPDAQAIILKGGRESALSFSIENPETLRKLDVEGKPIASTLNYELRRNASYRPLEPRVQMRGMYSYMADAGIFRECITQLKLPVAQLGDNAALEAAYGRSRTEPNQQLLVNLEGRIALQPRTGGWGAADPDRRPVHRYGRARPAGRPRQQRSRTPTGRWCARSVSQSSRRRIAPRLT
jgi:copper homeostasis protein (lipoprotein)